MRTTMKRTVILTGALMIAAPGASAAPPDRSGVDLRVSITDSPDPVRERRELTYTATVRNAGPGKATEVFLEIDHYHEFVSASGASCTDGLTDVCSLGTLGKGQTATVQLVVRARAYQPQSTATATVRSKESEVAPADNTATAVTTVNPIQYQEAAACSESAMLGSPDSASCESKPFTLSETTEIVISLVTDDDTYGYVRAWVNSVGSGGCSSAYLGAQFQAGRNTNFGPESATVTCSAGTYQLWSHIDTWRPTIGPRYVCLPVVGCRYVIYEGPYTPPWGTFGGRVSVALP